MTHTKSKDNQPFVLIDGSSFLYRSYHAPALSRLTALDGFPTGAMFGVNRMLDQIQRLYPTEYFVVVFDPRGKTRRHQWLESYKANRPPTPEDLSVQFAPLMEIIKARGIPCIVKEGEEADDVIGTLAVQAEKAGFEVKIATGDKDMAQLVTDKVTLINNIKNDIVETGISGVEKRFGVLPTQIVDYLAMMGDASDNIPGIPGVGAKTAARLLQKYGDFEGVVTNIDLISGKVGQSIRDHIDQFPLLRKLTSIMCDLELGHEVLDLKVADMQVETLKVLYKKFGFNASLKALDTITEATDSVQPEQTQAVELLDAASSATFIDRLKPPFWVHSLVLNPLSDQLEIHALFVGDHSQIGVLPCQQADWIETCASLIQSLQSAQDWYCHDYKQWLHNTNQPVTNRPFDLMIASYVLHSNRKHDFYSLCTQYAPQLEGQLQAIIQTCGKQDSTAVSTEDWKSTARSLAVAYTGVHRDLQSALLADTELKRLFDQIEMPLTTVLWHMEQNGIMVDETALREYSKELEQRIKLLEAQAFEKAQEPFNLDSPKQIREMLFERMGLPVVKKTASGEASTNEEVLQYLADKGHEIAAIIIKRRQDAKLKSTYTDGLVKHINPLDQRIHGRFNQAVANTGRLSSSHPNLQNIPIRGVEGKRLREAFIARPGYQLLAADYSQIELRILAHYCEDESMCQAFAEGLDIHTATAADVFNCPISDVSSDQRRYAKTINFGLIYGMGAFSLSNQLGIPRSEAESYITSYFERYPNVQGFMQTRKDFAHEHGYVETLFGRKIGLSDIRSKNHAVRQYAERAAINAPIQGTAADIIKMAMLELYEQTKLAQDIEMILQIHDELLFEVKQESQDKWTEIITTTMEQVAQLNVPLTVAVGIGNNWAQAH